jgi:hypothetical protein
MNPNAIRHLHDIASRQHGLFSIRQAEALGVTRWEVETAVTRGWLRAVRRSVYAVAGTAEGRWQPVMAAALAAGPGAAVSHRSAAAIHGFAGMIAGDLPELTIPFDCRRRLAGVRLHRSRSLAAEDLQVRRGVQLTTPIRTVIDIAGGTGDYLLGKVLDDGAIRRLWTPEAVADRLDRLGHSGRAGTIRLKALLDQRRGEGPQESELEQRVLRVLKRLKPQVPDPVVHYQRVLSGRVIDMDLAWPEHRIDGEIDGYLAHVQLSDFERDRTRANVLGAHEWHIVHWTSAMDDATIAEHILRHFGTDDALSGGHL